MVENAAGWTGYGDRRREKWGSLPTHVSEAVEPYDHNQGSGPVRAMAKVKGSGTGAALFRFVAVFVLESPYVSATATALRKSGAAES